MHFCLDHSKLEVEYCLGFGAWKLVLLVSILLVPERQGEVFFPLSFQAYGLRGGNSLL